MLQLIDGNKHNVIFDLYGQEVIIPRHSYDQFMQRWMKGRCSYEKVIECIIKYIKVLPCEKLYRMRDPNRIHRILLSLKNEWSKHPNLKLSEILFKIGYLETTEGKEDNELEDILDSIEGQEKFIG